MTTLSEYLQERRAEVETALAAYLQPIDIPIVLREAMRYSVEAGGKRLRPLLCLASAEAVHGDYRAALPAACAIEMIHTYSLIHDDLPAMDDDTMRRGRPTLHVVAGEGMAVLAGDGLLTEAFGLLVREPPDSGPAAAARKLRVIEVIAGAAGAAGMVGGQAIDLQAAASAATFDGESLRAMHARKTGALIRAAAVSGAIMGGASDADVAVVDTAAADLGLAFQIVDDILDVEAESAALGKTTGKDAAAGKPTYPSIYGVDRSRVLAADCLRRASEALYRVGLADSRLLEIGRWILERSH